PLGRARATGAIVAAACGADCSEQAVLAELDFGAAEGLTLAEVRARWPAWWAERGRDRWTSRWPSGESYADAAARLAGFRVPSGATLVVAHQSVLRALLVATGERPPAAAIEVRFAPCECVELSGESDALRPLPRAIPGDRSARRQPRS
ncbi:MAG TPA: histidine phosphatase family protein, partial [Candidatus Acidoferrales bacterium]|nr:histidine phosphatase family protein [Candidatus Acidoferrales bacterium]